MFFGSHLEVEAEEDRRAGSGRAGAAADAADTKSPEPAPHPPAPKPKPKQEPSRVRLAGIVEQIRRGFDDKCIGKRETITLPDGRKLWLPSTST